MAMRKDVFRAFLLVGLFLGAGVARGASSQEVGVAIRRCTKYLYLVEDHGSWERFHARKVWFSGSYEPGVLSATCTYSLLLAGESPDNPKLAEAIQFLLKTPTTKTLTAGIRCQVWRLLPDSPEIKEALRKDQETLLKGFHYDTGVFDDDLDNPGIPSNPSFTQYGVWGLWASSQKGIEIPTEFWKSVDANWRESQREDGSWFIPPGPDPVENTVSQKPAGGQGEADPSQTWIGRADLVASTASTIASLYMCQDRLNAGVIAGCEGNLTEPEIEKGLNWMQLHYQDVFRTRSRYATLYGIEQIGEASGLKYLGNKNWFGQGADFLLHTQLPNGCWDWDPGLTSLAMMFLVRGGAPVGFNKLRYAADPNHPETEGNWNQRPRDLANLENWITEQAELERLLNWQVVTLDAPVEDLHDSSILYITGDKALNFSPEQKKKIADFIEQGGMVLFNSDCGSSEFDESVKMLAADLYPKIGEFRELAADHPIMTNEQFLASNWKTPPVVLGLSNGVRELMILMPKADPSRSWQGQLSSSHSGDFELGADILLYASDKKNMREKGDSYVVEANSQVKATRSLKVARLQYEGNWDPEPGGWKRLAAVMHNQDLLDLDVTSVPLKADMVLDGFKVAHLTGTDHFKIDIATWAALRTFVENGGTLIIDAAGGSTNFAQDARSQLNTAFPENSDELDRPLRLTDALYTDIAPQIAEVNYRAFARHTLMENLKDPRIEALRIGDRAAIFLSNEDLSAGLVGEPVDGILGYDPDSATDLMEHMILYGESGGKPVDLPAGVAGGN